MKKMLALTLGVLLVLGAFGCAPNKVERTPEGEEGPKYPEKPITFLVPMSAGENVPLDVEIEVAVPGPVMA
jgi:hypothetical protein